MHHHKAQIILDWFLKHDNELTLLKWPPQSPDHLWDVVERENRIMDVQPTNLQQLCDAIISIWTKISEEMFPTLCWIYTKINQGSSEGKSGSKQGVPNKVASGCIYIYIYDK